MGISGYFGVDRLLAEKLIIIRNLASKLFSKIF